MSDGRLDATLAVCVWLLAVGVVVVVALAVWDVALTTALRAGLAWRGW